MTTANFKIRWNHQAKLPFASLRAGTELQILEYHKSIKLKIDGKDVKCSNIAKVKLLKPPNANQSEGYVNAAYIAHAVKPSMDKAESELVKENKWSPELVNGKWFLGCVSPVDASIRLCGDISLSAGSFVVCQPSEMWSKKDNEWPTYLVCIKTYTGAHEQFIYEWVGDEDYNLRYVNQKYPHRDTLPESLPIPPREPMPSVVYITIKRTKDGEYLFDGETKTFPSIFALLHYYKKHPFKVNVAKRVQLALPAQVVYEPTVPVTPIYPLEKVKRIKLGAEPLSLIQTPTLTINNFDPLLGKQKLSVDDQVSECGLLYKGYFAVNGVYKAVAIRKLSEKFFNLEAMNADLNLLKANTRRASADLSATQKGGLDERGSEYILHVVTYNVQTDDVFGGKWVAYEYGAGLPLDQFLKLRKFEADYLILRPKYEVMYQVAAAMRFLEMNGLCHRHLKASNVLVTTELPYIFRVKVTDYMLPYHFLNKKGVTKVAFATTEWMFFAPECIEKQIFNIRTDVWSFGCLIFEIMTDGLIPYSLEEKPFEKKEDLIEFLKNGKQMALVGENNDQFKDNFISAVLQQCMRHLAKDRPTFEKLFQFFYGLLFNFVKNPVEVIKEFVKEDTDSPFQYATTDPDAHNNC